ncbi:RNA methyltransferase, putative [Hepatocystis sp. ex Piliocolobus tephrosceles]|nr:RNA methyltransferase, putative [Hepatocystis sp. ex Piliocolobus tephrosceles]
METEDSTKSNVTANGESVHIKMYVVIYNIGKKKNIGCIVRSCVAFNVSEIFIVGKKKKEISFFGNMGTYEYINIKYFNNIIELKTYLNKNNILLYACEISYKAVPITEKPFVKQPTAFLFGNEGTGISKNILDLCDKIIYIPQYGNGTASLNVAVSCAIILQKFAEWANYRQVEIEGNKFFIKKSEGKLHKYLNASDDLKHEINNKRIMRLEKKNDFYLTDFSCLL